MFSGITRGTFPIVALERTQKLLRYAIELSVVLGRGLQVGSSVSVDGVCQTVVSRKKSAKHVRVVFEAIEETLKLTTLGSLKEGDRVSVERSARLSDELGGHLLSGHIIGTGEVLEVHTAPGMHDLRVQVPATWMKYILPKGFIAVDGSSLTVGSTDPRGSFALHLIPETLRLTNLGRKRRGDRVNVELDARTVAIVDTVERVLRAGEPSELRPLAQQEPPHAPPHGPARERAKKLSPDAGKRARSR